MVNPGYKRTEIGILPTNWELALLTDKCELLNGLTYTPDNVQDNGLLVLRSSNIQNGQINLGDTVFVNCMVDKEKYVKKDDILICVRNGSAALIGKCAKADRDYYATFGAFMAVLRGQNNDFIFQLLQQGNIQKHINKNSDSTINQITNADFKSIVIPWPSEADERETIATALSDIDALITNLEKLIAKKKAIKQGAMQELLTGKRRLPGFDGEWGNVVIGENGYLLRESINPQIMPLSVFSEYSMPAFDFGKKPNRVVGADMHSNRTVISGNVLLFNKLNVRQKRIWLVCASEKNAVCSSEFLPYCSDAISLRFLAHVLGTEEVTAYFIGSSTGTSNSQKRITPATFLEYSLFAPLEISEQNAIADVLDNMDREIVQLEQKLKKYQNIKCGMMSELLTGRIRLV